MKKVVDGIYANINVESVKIKPKRIENPIVKSHTENSKRLKEINKKYFEIISYNSKNFK